MLVYTIQLDMAHQWLKPLIGHHPLSESRKNAEIYNSLTAK